MRCQATFKEYCQHPKCDCDRGNYEDRMQPRLAQIKFNGGRGALLCERCNIIIREDFNPRDIEDKIYYCEKHTPTRP